MTALGLRLPIDIPWKRIGVSRHMMDPQVCDRRRPLPMQPSVAVFSYEPEESPGEPLSAFRTSYLKVSVSVTSYGATNLERLRGAKIKVGSPYFDWRFHGSSHHASESIQFDSSQRLDGADFPCFGALLEVSVGPHGGSWDLNKFPYFSDFEPKKRELYELVSETGEIMSRSLEQAGVLHGGTTSTSSEVFDKDTIGLSHKEKHSAPTHGENSAENAISYSTESGSRNVADSQVRRVQTADASREARETFSHTTQLTQMYQLLSSFHIGTNRAVFFFEPRPRLVQTPETFIDGPRKLEGVQEFFLVVVRPRDMEEICVDVSLETLHVGATYRAPPEEPRDELNVLLELPPLGWNGSWPDPDTDKPFISDNVVSYLIPPHLELDYSKGGGKGWDYQRRNIVGQAIPTVDITAASIFLKGHVEEFHYEGDWLETDRRQRGFLDVAIWIYLKPRAVAAPTVDEFAFLTNTSVCTCPSRVDLREELEGGSIVREIKVPQTRYPVGKPMPVGEAERWGRFYSQATRSSMSSSDRYPRGSVGFWDLDALRAPLADLTHGRKWTPRDVKRIAEAARKRLADGPGKRHLASLAKSPDRLGHHLRQGLRDFAEEAGLELAEAAAMRRAFWDEALETATRRPEDEPAAKS